MFVAKCDGGCMELRHLWTMRLLSAMPYHDQNRSADIGFWPISIASPYVFRRLHLRLPLERDWHLDHRPAAAELRDLRRAQLQLDDRGVRQSGRDKRIFRHNDTEHLAELLRTAGERAKLIVFEGRCWMDGDVAPIKSL